MDCIQNPWQRPLLAQPGPRRLAIHWVCRSSLNSRSSRPATSLLWAANLASGEIHSHSFLNLIICSRQICKCLLCTHLHHELHFTMTWCAYINHLKMIIVTNRSLIERLKYFTQFYGALDTEVGKM